MNTLVKTLFGIAVVVGAAAALLFSGLHMSGTATGAQMMSSGARFGEFGGYLALMLLIAALGSVVAWMLFGKTE